MTICQRLSDHPQNVLSLSSISKHYGAPTTSIGRLLGRKGKQLTAVSDVSFDVLKGETFAIVGESGCGKSTLARIIAGLTAPSTGAVEYHGARLENMVSDRPDQIRRNIQMVFQDPYSSLNPRWTVGDLVAEPMRQSGDNRAIKAKTNDLLRTVGLRPEDADRYPHQFSGGQRQRICIARALASEPGFIVWDEPTSALDISVQAQILNLIRNLQNEYGLTFVFISHNLGVIYNLADRVAVMYLGRIVEIGSVDKVLTDPVHPYTRMLVDAVPTVRNPKRSFKRVTGDIPDPSNPPPGCAFNTRCMHAVEECRQSKPALDIGKQDRKVACFQKSQLSKGEF